MNARAVSVFRSSINALTALMLTAVLFAVLPGLRSAYRFALRETATIPFENRMMPDVKKEERRQRRVPQQMLRTIRTPARAAADRVSRESFRFAPDLGVQGGNDVAGPDRNRVKSQIFDEEETDVRPVLAVRTPIPYPPEARRLGIEGMVDLEILVDESGRVVKINFNQLPSEHFKAPVIRSVMRWRFRPAQVQGVAVSVRVRQKITYRLSQTSN